MGCVLKFNFIRHYNADKVFPPVCVDGSSCPIQSWKQFLEYKKEWSQRWCLEFTIGEGLRIGYTVTEIGEGENVWNEGSKVKKVYQRKSCFN